MCSRLAIVLIGWALTSVASGEDVVLVASATEPTKSLKKTGQILDYTGVELTLKNFAGTVERIAAGRVIELQTTWTIAHEAGRAARLAGQLDEAIVKLREALGEEQRGWARRQIAAELTGSYLESGKIADAVETFLPIVASDPQTFHYNIAPVAWRAAAPDPTLERRAATWLGDSQPELTRLLGASWLLPGGRRAAAIAALERLRSSADGRIAALAEIQLWRTKLVTAKPEEARRWQERLDKLPVEVQPTGWYVLGEVLARQKDAEAAALAYLKVAVLFREHRPLAADSLLAAGMRLEQLGKITQAAGLYRELTRDFGHLPAAGEGEARLAKLTAAAEPAKGDR